MKRFPISTGLIVSRVKSGLSASSDSFASNVGVWGSLPGESKRTQRMVVFRNDSGPWDGVIARRRYGVNVYAESSVIAEKLANLVMSILSASVDDQLPMVDQLSGPYEVTDENPVIVSSTALSQFFFTARISVRAS